MKPGDRFVYLDKRDGSVHHLEFRCINQYGNYNFDKLEVPITIPELYRQWIWLPEQIELLMSEELWNSPLMKALR